MMLGPSVYVKIFRPTSANRQVLRRKCAGSSHRVESVETIDSQLFWRQNLCARGWGGMYDSWLRTVYGVPTIQQYQGVYFLVTPGSTMPNETTRTPRADPSIEARSGITCHSRPCTSLALSLSVNAICTLTVSCETY